ncbi:serine endopeptidase [Plectosphaerella plurivora]|uniref:Serine endopeptidase n=1 Tax=Plectosphaerella plurivora TaxID=936078 RepID=A0A9P8V9V1_9PEZI|nr:serine endopeptidase [Plectosphaerella plurivora]
MLLRLITFVYLVGNASAVLEWHARLNNDTAAQSRRFIVECGKGQDVGTLGGIIQDRLGGRVLRNFSTSVFCGVSVEASHVNLDSFLALGAISNVWQSKQLELGPVSPSMPTTQGAITSNYSIHHMTNVDRLHKEGIFGKGVKIAVIDTGVDYNHSALGGGFGPGFKVAGGYDFVGEDWYPGGTAKKEPKDDPMDQFGHGSHVAGIIAGKTEHWAGVAPEATILGYKVSGSSGGTDEDTLIEAFLVAHEDGADIITASIGGPGGWASGAWATVASRIVEDGTVVTISAGNSGSVGPFFGSTGSSGKYVLAVASVDADTLPGLAFEATLAERNTTEPFGNVVVISPERTGQLIARGARHVLFDNDTQFLLPRPSLQEGLLYGAIDYDTAKILIDAAQRKVDVRLIFSPENSMRSGGVASYFTSLATLFDLQIKPDIAALGGKFFSSYLNNTFQILSGTYMACPYVAGIAALYIGKHGGRREHGRSFAKALAMRLMSSGRPMKWSDGVTQTDYGEWAPVMQVGTGLVDAYKVLSWAKFGLNDTDHHQPRHRVAITNEGPKRARYRFSAQVAGGIEGIDTDIDPSLVQIGPVPAPPIVFRPSAMKPDIVFPEDIWVESGATRNADFSFNLSVQSQEFLQIDCAFRWGVSHLRWDIFEPGWKEEDWKYPPVPGQNGFIGAVTSWVGAGRVFRFDPEEDDEDDVITFLVHGLTRSLIYSYWWLGELTDGTKINLGTTRSMRFAALAPSGDPKESGDWSVFEVPEIQITSPRK